MPRIDKDPHSRLNWKSALCAALGVAVVACSGAPTPTSEVTATPTAIPAATETLTSLVTATPEKKITREQTMALIAPKELSPNDTPEKWLTDGMNYLMEKTLPLLEKNPGENLQKDFNLQIYTLKNPDQPLPDVNLYYFVNQMVQEYTQGRIILTGENNAFTIMSNGEYEKQGEKIFRTKTVITAGANFLNDSKTDVEAASRILHRYIYHIQQKLPPTRTDVVYSNASALSYFLLNHLHKLGMPLILTSMRQENFDKFQQTVLKQHDAQNTEWVAWMYGADFDPKYATLDSYYNYCPDIVNINQSSPPQEVTRGNLEQIEKEFENITRDSLVFDEDIKESALNVLIIPVGFDATSVKNTLPKYLPSLKTIYESTAMNFGYLDRSLPVGTKIIRLPGVTFTDEQEVKTIMHHLQANHEKNSQFPEIHRVAFLLNSPLNIGLAKYVGDRYFSISSISYDAKYYTLPHEIGHFDADLALGDEYPSVYTNNTNELQQTGLFTSTAALDPTARKILAPYPQQFQVGRCNDDPVYRHCDPKTPNLMSSSPETIRLALLAEQKVLCQSQIDAINYAIGEILAGREK